MDQEFEDQINTALNPEKQHYIQNSKRRTIIASATLGKSFWTSRVMNKQVKKKYKKLLKENPETAPNMKLQELLNKIKFKNKTKVVDLTQVVLLPETLEILKVDCLKEEKSLFLYHFIKSFPDDPIMVFTNSITSSKRIKALMDVAGISSLSLHAEMQQRQRIKKLDQFRQGKYRVLIATDVASRGIDVDNVGVVLHYHSPKDIDTMVHRCGRTARQGRPGKSIILADSDDRSRLVKYSKDLGQNAIKNITVPFEKLDPLREIINEAQRVEKIQHRDSLSKKDESWKIKMALEAGIELSEDEKDENAQADRIRKENHFKARKENLRAVTFFNNPRLLRINDLTSMENRPSMYSLIKAK